MSNVWSTWWDFPLAPIPWHISVFANYTDDVLTFNRRIGSGTNVISGMSMATPHVSVFVAYLLGVDSSLSVAAIEATIDSIPLKTSSPYPSLVSIRLDNNFRS